MQTAENIINSLGLRVHPEGGWYKEIYRSLSNIISEGRERSALTTIYFLLQEGQVSRWHVVDADEVWHFYEGDPLELFVAPPDFSKVECIRLQEITKGGAPVYVVPAGWWQAARTGGIFTLVGCTVAPGFEFSGFRFLDETERNTMTHEHPDYITFI